MLLNLLSYLRLVFMEAFSHLGRLNPPEQADTEEETTNYVLLMDELCPSPVPVPIHILTALIKKRLPVINFSSFLKRLGKHEDDEESMCPVCLECIKGKDEIRELCNCSHVFHRHCLDTWVDEGKVACPSCRFMMFTNKMGLDYMVYRESIDDWEESYLFWWWIGWPGSSSWLN